jgi:SAM-dependent methyltransferase
VIRLKEKVKRIKLIRRLHSCFISSLKDFIKIDIFLYIRQIFWFKKQYNQLKFLQKNNEFQNIEWYPCLLDNVKFTPLDPVYFFQDTWAAQKIFRLKPEHHYDVGSNAKTIGILSQFVPITMIDIRPLPLELKGLTFLKGSILKLPFEDNSISSISSLCVVEHIGLGRYGDELDQFGSEKAISELKRVVKPEGVILFSVPVCNENKVFFNAHRAFTRDYIMKLFHNFELLDEQYQYGNALYKEYCINKGFGTGLFMLRKKEI